MDTGADKRHVGILSSLLASGSSPAPTHQPAGTRTGKPQAKQLTGQGQSPTQQRGCLKTPRAHSHSWTQPFPPETPGTQLYLPVDRHQPQNALGPQPHPPASVNTFLSQTIPENCSRRNTSKLILWSQLHPDTKTRERYHKKKKIMGQYTWLT